VLALEDLAGSPLINCSVPPATLPPGRMRRAGIGRRAFLASGDRPLRPRLATCIDACLVHKDVKPANVLVNPDTSQAWLMGFGVASRLPRERQSPDLPEFHCGDATITWRPNKLDGMNRSTDSRSDLYSFGVTLYEVLTGLLPFTASDSMEWVPLPRRQTAQSTGCAH